MGKFFLSFVQLRDINLLYYRTTMGGHGHSHGGHDGHGHSHSGHGHSHGSPAPATENTSLLAAHATTPSKTKEVLSKKDKLAQNKAGARRKMLIAGALCFVFMLVELVGGYIAGSLAVMTDAAHLLTDVAGFMISIFASYMSIVPPSSRHSYGFMRAEILGAIISVLLIWALTIILVWEALGRLFAFYEGTDDVVTDGKTMFIVAVFGCAVNIMIFNVLHSENAFHSHGGHGGHGHSHGGHGHSHGGHGHSHGGSSAKKKKKASKKQTDGKEHAHSHGGGHGHSHGDREHDHDHDHSAKFYDTDLESNVSDTDVEETFEKFEDINISASAAHALGDLIQSIGVCIAGGLIWYNPDWQMADPLATLLFSVLVIYTTMGVISSSVRVLMEATPEHIDITEVRAGLLQLEPVLAVHDLHVWSLTLGQPSLSVHLVALPTHTDEALAQAQEYCRDKGIDHTTIQVEVHERKYPSVCVPCSPHAHVAGSNANGPSMRTALTNITVDTNIELRQRGNANGKLNHSFPLAAASTLDASSASDVNRSLNYQQ